MIYMNQIVSQTINGLFLLLLLVVMQVLQAYYSFIRLKKTQNSGFELVLRKKIIFSITFLNYKIKKF